MKKHQPKNQHYLPKMFLNGFTNKNGHLYRLDNQKGVLELRNPKSIAYEPHLYTIQNDQKRLFSVEEGFSKIETEADPILKKIIISDFRHISDEEINTLVNFVITLFIRTPHTVRVAEQVMRNQSVLDEMRAIDQNSAEKYIDACNKWKGLSFASTFQAHHKYRHDTFTKNFDALLSYTSPDSPPFIINDNFSCLEMMSNHVPYINDDVDWENLNGKIHFPISNRHCLSFIPKTDPLRKGTYDMVFTKGRFPESSVKIINRESFKQQDRYTYCSDQNLLLGAMA